MKLILSSRDFSEPASAQCIRDHLGLPLEDCKVLYFPNEKADERSIRGNKYYNRLARFGFRKENVTVFNYYDPTPFFGRDFDAVYISGGNTFGTIKRIREAGFTPELIRIVRSGAVYIGGSAGAHIASADLSHVARYDTDTYGLTDFSGLGLYEGIFLCHFGEEREAHLAQLRAEGRYTVIPLRNEESFLFETEKE